MLNSSPSSEDKTFCMDSTCRRICIICTFIKFFMEIQLIHLPFCLVIGQLRCYWEHVSQFFVHLVQSFQNTRKKCAHQNKAFENMKHQKESDLLSWGDLMNKAGGLLLHIVILSFYFFFLCPRRIYFPISQTPGHCFQNYFLAGLLQQLPQPHHLPVL